MGHQVIKLQNPLKTLGFLQFYRFKTVKDRNISHPQTKSKGQITYPLLLFPYLIPQKTLPL